MSEILFVGSYEARLIPAGWQHPRDGRGFVPELPTHDVALGGLVLNCMAGVCATDANDPRAVVAYEAVSEGTPVSPAFPDTPQGRLDLCNWLAANEKVMGKRLVDAEAWAAILFGDAAISADGIVVGND